MWASSSQGLEFDIGLTADEINRLEREAITGSIEIRETGLPARILEIVRGEIPRTQWLLDCLSFPERAGYEKIEKYKVIVGEEGYEMLKEKGVIIDRMGIGGSNQKITIHKGRYGQY